MLRDGFQSVNSIQGDLDMTDLTMPETPDKALDLLRTVGRN